MKLIDVAADAGVDIVKFQTFKADKLVTRDAPKAGYQTRTTPGEDRQYAMLKRLELTDDAFGELMLHAARRGVGFLSTPFDGGSAKLLADLGVPAFKVSSGDLTNLPFLRELASFRLPIILSSGMASMAELDEAVSALMLAGVKAADLTLLHCTTEYPAPLDEVNLKAMTTMRAAYPGTGIGYSDHTEGIHIPVAAAALGAEMLEKHFTLDRTMEGPDHKASLEPGELKAMVAAVRGVEAALGDGWKRPTATELPNRIAARKSIVAARDIRAGETLTDENLATRRPGNGISPMRWDEIAGLIARRDYKRDEMI